MALIADIFITHKPGRDFLNSTLRALRANTDREDYRLHLVVDGWPGLGIVKDIGEFRDNIDHVLLHHENIGLGPSINQALDHIDVLNRWFDHPTHGDQSKVAPFVCYIQDDVLVTKGW